MLPVQLSWVSGAECTAHGAILLDEEEERKDGMGHASAGFVWECYSHVFPC